MVRAVLFDFWGTLATAPPGAGRDALKRALAAAGVERPFDEVQRAWDAAKAEGSDPLAETDYDERFRRTFKALGLRARFANSGARVAAQRYLDESANAARLFPEALDALRALPPGTRVAVVSNFADAGVFRRMLDRLGLAGRLDAAVCSADAGRRKPDPAPFRVALERLEVAPAEAVMVGDGADDVAGARAAGLQTVFVSREGRAPPEDAVAVVTDLGELSAVLARLGAAENA